MNKNLILLSAATLGILGCSLSTHVYAQKENQPPSVFAPGTPAPEKITVYGREFAIRPYRLSDSSITWQSVKSDLPKEITDKQAHPMPNAAILAHIDHLHKESQYAYERSLDNVVKQKAATDPKANLDAIELDIAGQLAEQQGGKTYPDLQTLYNQTQALDFLNQMLRQSMGLGAPKF